MGGIVEKHQQYSTIQNENKATAYLNIVADNEGVWFQPKNYSHLTSPLSN